MPALKLLMLVVGCLLVLSLGQPRAAEQEGRGFLDRVHKGADGKESKYVLFVPHDYKGDKSYPIILFLHGAGEREGGTKAPVDVGIGPAIKKYGEKDFPFFVVLPRCASKSSWLADTPDAERALATLDEVMKTFKIDSQRVYLTGLSMGGYGTWSLAIKHPDRWSAIVPICGRGDPTQAAKIKDLPCWCFHGDADPSVKVDFSRQMIKALRDAGGEPKYYEFPGVGHNSWDQAYGDKDLYEWLLSHKRKP